MDLKKLDSKLEEIEDILNVLVKSIGSGYAYTNNSRLLLEKLDEYKLGDISINISNSIKHQLNLECQTCKIYVIYPIEQLKVGGLFLDNLKCINCQSILKVDLMVSP